MRSLVRWVCLRFYPISSTGVLFNSTLLHDRSPRERSKKKTVEVQCNIIYFAGEGPYMLLSQSGRILLAGISTRVWAYLTKYCVFNPAFLHFMALQNQVFWVLSWYTFKWQLNIWQSWSQHAREEAWHNSYCFSKAPLSVFTSLVLVFYIKNTQWFDN